jgi:hypothetical protein
MNSQKFEAYQQIIQTKALLQVTLNQLNSLIESNEEAMILNHEKLIEIIRGLISVNHDYMMLTVEVTYE